MLIVKVASLMKFIETPPPTLLRAQFAIVLDHLPSVPTVNLLNKSAVLNDWAFSHFKLIILSNKTRVAFISRISFAFLKITFNLSDGNQTNRKMTKNVIFLMTLFGY